jgi:multiple sugar transport system permease protein
MSFVLRRPRNLTTLNRIRRERYGRGAVPKRSTLSYTAREIRAGRLLMVPALVAPVCLSLVFLAGIYVTLNNWRLTTGNAGFVGVANYAHVLSDGKFWHSLLLTLEFTFIDISIEVVVGTLMALALNEALRGIRIYRSLLVLPLMTPPVVGALVWKVLFRSGTGGFFNFLLWSAGLPMQGFLGTPEQALYSLVLIDVWLNMPFIATILLAGLQTLPQEPLEAARIDGATAWQTFWRLKLPMLVPFYLVALMFRLIDSLNVFDTIYGTTSGGPGDTTRVLSINGYETAFPFYSLSTGLTVFMMLWIICMMTGWLLYGRVKATEAR